MLALVILGTFSSATAQGSLENERARLSRDVLVPALDELATWCNSKRLYGRRSEVYEVLLRFDPTHTAAHLALKHKRVKGQWTPPRRPYRPKDRGNRAREQFGEKRAELLGPYCEAVIAQLEENGLRPFDEAGRALLGDALLASPDDAAVHAFLDEVQVAGSWVLEETARASLRCEELRALWDDAMANAKGVVEEDVASSEELALGVDWKVVVAGEGVRVLGTGSRAEVQRAAEVNQAAGAFLHALFDRPARHARGSTIFLLADEDDPFDFLASYPGLSESDREFYQTLQGVALRGGARVAQWGIDEEHRLDAATRHTIDAYLQRTFWVKLEEGWVWEGLGAYLTWRLTGTRLTWRVAAAGGLADDSEYLSRQTLFATAPEEWLTLAHELFCESDELDLARVLDKRIDDMNADDLLASYALAAYLVEGRTELGEVLRRLGRGQVSRDALTEVLGMDFPELQWRLCGWLGQRALSLNLASEDLRASVPLVSVGGVQPAASSAASEAPATVRGVAVALSPSEARRLLKRVEKMSRSKRESLLARCREAAQAGGAPQVELVRAWIGEWERSGEELSAPTELSSHDTTAFRDRSKRTRIGPGDRRWDEIRARLPAADPGSTPPRVSYELATGRIVAAPDRSNDATDELRGLLDGVLPGQDLAEALLYQSLDRDAVLRDEANYFAHLYTDVDGREYAGIELYDIWASGAELDVPDAEVRVYAAKLWATDDLPIPLPEADREMWYSRMLESLHMLRNRKLLLESVTRVWFQGTPDLPLEYERGIDVLHGIIALESGDREALTERIEREGTAFLTRARAQLEASGTQAWDVADARRRALDRGRDRIRRAVLEVLAEDGLIER